MLEWVFGCIVSTAEKARDAAQRCLNLDPPSGPERAWACLRAALAQQRRWVDLQRASSELEARIGAMPETSGLNEQCVGHPGVTVTDLDPDLAPPGRINDLKSHPVPEDDLASPSDSADSAAEQSRQTRGAGALGWLPPRPPPRGGPSRPSAEAPHAPPPPSSMSVLAPSVSGSLSAAEPMTGTDPKPSTDPPPSAPHRLPSGWRGDRHALCVLDHEAATAWAEVHLLDCEISMEEQSIRNLEMKLAMVRTSRARGPLDCSLVFCVYMFY